MQWPTLNMGSKPERLSGGMFMQNHHNTTNWYSERFCKTPFLKITGSIIREPNPAYNLEVDLTC